MRTAKLANQNGLAKRGAGRVKQPSPEHRPLAGFGVTTEVDAPGGGGKIPLLPNQPLDRRGDHILLENFQGKIFRYPAHPPKLVSINLRREENQDENLAAKGGA